MSMPCIQPAQREDLPEILKLQYLAYQSEARLFHDPDIPPLRQTLSELQTEFDRGAFLKALDENGRIVGSVRACCEGDTAYIGKLMVHPDHQRRGLGSRLLRTIENACHVQRYELFTSTKSAGNIRLYQRLGYQIFKEEKITEELTFVYLEK